LLGCTPKSPASKSAADEFRSDAKHLVILTSPVRFVKKNNVDFFYSQLAKDGADGNLELIPRN